MRDHSSPFAVLRNADCMTQPIGGAQRRNPLVRKALEPLASNVCITTDVNDIEVLASPRRHLRLPKIQMKMTSGEKGVLAGTGAW